MKSKIFILVLLFLGTSAVFTGCKKDKDEPAKTTAGLIVKVKVNGIGFFTGATVKIATSADLLASGFYLKVEETTATGADFGQLPAGTYYYECAYNASGIPLYGKSMVTLIAGIDQVVELVIN